MRTEAKWRLERATSVPVKGSGGRVVIFTRLLAALATFGIPAMASGQGWEMRVCADPNVLPFSHRAETGFENRIAELLASELDATLTYLWFPQGETMVREQLREGACDLIMGVPDGTEPLLSTLAYYRSPYVFVYREDRGFDLRSFDDPVLHELSIGVQRSGIPPHSALVARGLAANVTLQYGQWGVRPADPLRPLIDAVAAGDVDVGLAWGPVAGYYSARQPVALRVVPVHPEIDPPFLSMVLPMTIGVRRGDEALRDRLGMAITARWDEIQAILEAYGVPRSPLPPPVPTRIGEG